MTVFSLSRRLPVLDVDIDVFHAPLDYRFRYHAAWDHRPVLNLRPRRYQIALTEGSLPLTNFLFYLYTHPENTGSDHYENSNNDIDCLFDVIHNRCERECE
jgi:hypothetical protein